MLEFKRAFKRKTIEKNLKDKVDRWLKIIEIPKDGSTDEQIIENRLFINAIKNDLIITGGAIASMQMGYLPNDYDVYFKTTETAAKVSKYYVDKVPVSGNKNTNIPEIIELDNGICVKIKSSGVAGEDIIQDDYTYFEYMPANSSERYLNQISTKDNGKYEVAFMTSNAITLTDGIQIIVRFCGEAGELHENFDFVHCTNYWTYDGGLILNQAAIESILSRELKYVGSKYPICSMFRLRKFIDRGWTITAGEIFKIAWDINKLDLTNVNTLQEQLIGVDAAYFNEVINSVKEHVKTHATLDRTYLFELINRTFDANVDKFGDEK